jgi:phosphoglycolate phosphatase
MMNAAGEARMPRWHGDNLRGVLFDLDGTLLDTADDIATALNLALAEFHLAPLATEHVRNMIGGGAPILVDRALARLGVDANTLGHAATGSEKPGAQPNGAAGNSGGRAKLLQRFDFHYERQHHLQQFSSRAYPGAAEALRELHERGLKLAVVTNKGRPMAVELLNGLGLGTWIDVVVGGGCSGHRKPRPEPLLFACTALKLDPREVLMVGDSINDVTAARAAGIPVVCVPYGYNEGRDPRELPCDAIIESLADLPNLLSSASRHSC